MILKRSFAPLSAESTRSTSAAARVDITSGKFVFSASEAYAIENGKLGAPLKGATLIGNGPDVLTRSEHWSGTT